MWDALKPGQVFRGRQCISVEIGCFPLKEGNWGFGWWGLGMVNFQEI